MNGSITLLFNEDGLSIELMDDLSRERFLKVELNAEQACQALGRLAFTKCSFTVSDLDKVGKKQLYERFEFEVLKDTRFKNRDKVKEIAIAQCPEGWTPDLNFSSRDSFFSKDGKDYARTMIRKWVAVGDEDLAKWEDQCNQN